MTTLSDINIALGLLFTSGLLLGGILSWHLGRAHLRRTHRRALLSREPWLETYTCDRS